MYDYKKEAELDQAAYNIGQFCKNWGRISVRQTKVKYNSVRVYCSFQLSLHSLIHPGYERSLFPKWLWVADIYYITPALNFLFGGLAYRWQKVVYRQAYKRELARCPEYRKEILLTADYPDILAGL
jgi:hypothetical protein